MSKIDQFDDYLLTNGPAALVLRVPLEAAEAIEGDKGVIFPATYAATEDTRVFSGGYNIDVFPTSEELARASIGKRDIVKPTVEMFPTSPNICLIDSVGSQANRIEPIFKGNKNDGPYPSLIPQIFVNVGDEEPISITEAGHRAGDALFRCSELQPELEDAFKLIKRGDALALAKIAPTSLVFGVWDSRNTFAKVPRLVTSCIRAFNVHPVHRGAVYNPPADYARLEVFSEKEKEKAEGNAKNPLSKRGFVNALASWSHGGVIAQGGVRRDATLSLSALRQCCRTSDPAECLKLQRYIMGLALVAFTYSSTGYLRQGCNLIGILDQPGEPLEVHGNGERKPAKITHEDAIAFAQAAAKDFGIGEDRTVKFLKEKAKADVKK